MAYNMAPMSPLKGSFMIMSMVGFLISVFYIYRNVSQSYGFAFAIVFLVMFIASLVSMNYSETGAELQIDAKRAAPVRTVEKRPARKKAVKKKTVRRRKKRRR